MEWNGLDDVGRMVPDGVYEIESSASTIFTTVTNRLSVIKTSERVPQFLRRRQAERVAPGSRAEGQLGQSVGWE